MSEQSNFEQDVAGYAQLSKLADGSYVNQTTQAMWDGYRLRARRKETLSLQATQLERLNMLVDVLSSYTVAGSKEAQVTGELHKLVKTLSVEPEFTPAGIFLEIPGEMPDYRHIPSGRITQKSLGTVELYKKRTGGSGE